MAVVKADHVQDEAGVQRKISAIIYDYQQAFLANRFVTFLFDLSCGKMRLSRLESI